jgi:cell division protein YceG involved in septum cleavage
VTRFRLLAHAHNALGQIKAGEYELNTGWTPDQVLRHLIKGQSMLFRLVVREGLTWWETAKAVADQGFARFEDFAAVIHDPAFLRAHNIPFDDAEGFLYPETYLLPKPRKPLDKEQARAVADIMVKMFWKKTEALWRRLPLKPEAAQTGEPLLPPLPGAMSSQAAPTAGAAPRTTAEAPAALPAPSSPGDKPVAAKPLAANATTEAAPPAQPASTGAASLAAGKDAASPSEAADASAPPAPTGQRPPENRLKLSEMLAQRAAEEGGTGKGPVVRGVIETTPVLPPAAESRTAPAQPDAAPTAPAGNGTAMPTAHKATAPAAIHNGTATTPQGGASGPEPSKATTALPAQADQGTAPAHNATVASPAVATGPQSPDQVDPAALRRLVILASLVEKETGLPNERGTVAGVYANRLRRGMLLQCDPTIIYGIGPSFSGAIRRSQLEDADNRYNTYKHAGLPPGPICSPGLASLKAAFGPEQHEYLYFVATGLDGGHSFSKTMSEHNKAVQIYRARMRNKPDKTR